MHLGLGLYQQMLTQDNFRFARQVGATHIVAHLTDYFRDARLPSASNEGWGSAGDPRKIWTVEELRDLRAAVNAEGLELAALENFDPSHWYDVLLDGPRKREQLENVKQIIRAVGQAGIPVMGYNFSLASVWGHVRGRWARGGAETVGFLGPDGPAETPIPNGMVWNMTYDADAPAGVVGVVTQEQLWARLTDFLDAALPVAEESGVMLALHPDDPPMPTLRGTARLVYRPEIYQRVLDLRPSPANGMEFCIGTLAEMNAPDGPFKDDIYAVVDHYCRTQRIGYIHFRNVVGKVPSYHEVFLDEGQVDMVRVLRILHRHGYPGVLIPDHTPNPECAAPWHAGMAFALGYMKAALRLVEEGC